MRVELLHFAPESGRSARIFAALKLGLPSDMTLTDTRRYSGGSDLLLLWGPGAPDRFDPMRQQLAAGGHVLAGDLAYWDRDVKFRVSFDAPHPQAWVMRTDRPSDRLRADGVVRGALWDPKGPVIVAGIGEKAHVQYGRGTVQAWERAAIDAAKAAGYRVRYRPKKHAGNPFACDSIPYNLPIGAALRGASCVVTWHSNVSVDAIRMGVPAVCQDGAAAAVCESSWRPGIQPLDPAIADQFLANLSFFQWAPSEAAQCWRFVREVLA